MDTDEQAQAPEEGERTVGERENGGSIFAIPNPLDPPSYLDTDERTHYLQLLSELAPRQRIFLNIMLPPNPTSATSAYRQSGYKGRNPTASASALKRSSRVARIIEMHQGRGQYRSVSVWTTMHAEVRSKAVGACVQNKLPAMRGDVVTMPDGLQIEVATRDQLRGALSAAALARPQDVPEIQRRLLAGEDLGSLAYAVQSWDWTQNDRSGTRGVSVRLVDRMQAVRALRELEGLDKPKGKGKSSGNVILNILNAIDGQSAGPVSVSASEPILIGSNVDDSANMDTDNKEVFNSQVSDVSSPQ